MKAIILKELRERRWSLLAYSVMTLVFIWMYISIFPSLQAQSQGFSQVLDSLPQGIAQTFGIDSGFLTNIHGYLAGEMYSLIWPILAITFLLSRAGGMLAGEIEKGTITTLLAMPLSRTKLFVSKYLAGVFALIVFIVASILATIPLAAAYKVTYWSHNFLLLSWLALLFGLAIFSFSYMLSALFSERSKVYAVVGGLLFVMYALNIISNLKTSLNWMHNFSVFYYFDTHGALVEGATNPKAYLLFGIATVVFSIVGWWIFTRRDISV
jgi:ABC-type transport system involved in multi-copper enzyme maturation permease subunit